MMKYTTISAAAVALGISHKTDAFTALQIITTPQKVHHAATLDDVVVSEDEVKAVNSKDLKRQQLKQALLGRLGDTNTNSRYDPVLCDPFTQESLSLSSIKGPILGGARSGGVRLSLTSESGDTFEGRTNTYINLNTMYMFVFLYLFIYFYLDWVELQGRGSGLIIIFKYI